MRERRRNTIGFWAERGVAGRGVLIDAETALGGAGAGFNPGSARQITVEELDAARAAAGIEWQPGDVLVLHTGFLAWHMAQDQAARETMADAARLQAVGLAHNEDMARYLWNAHVSAIVADNPSVEVWPPDGREEAYPFGFLHRMLIGQFGIGLGELWWTGGLAQACRREGRYEFLFTAAPLNVPGGVGSPANALAIL